MHYLGIKFYPAALAALVATSYLTRNHYRQHTGKTADDPTLNLYLCAYVNFALAVFFLAKPLYYAASSGAWLLFNSYNIQQSLVFLAGSLAVQCIIAVLSITPFTKFVAIPVINLLSCFFIVPLFGVAIVNVVWAFVFSGMLYGYLIASFFMLEIKRSVNLVAVLRPDDIRTEWLTARRAEADKYLKIATDLWLALGGSLGVSMTILFGWSKNSEKPPWSELEFQLTAALMVLAFLLTTVGLIGVVLKPYFTIAAKINELDRAIISHARNNSKSAKSRNRGSVIGA
jgi:hypothetical protein